MKHKHYDMIVAWAEGAKVQVRYLGRDWVDLNHPNWDGKDVEYRIKPEPKPDFVTYLTVAVSHTGQQTLVKHYCDNVKFTYDGETGALKSAEVI